MKLYDPTVVAKLSTYAVLVVFTGIMLIPFAFVVCATFKNCQDSFNYLFLPLGEGWLGVAWDRLTLNNLYRLHSELSISRNFLNSVFLASVTSVLATLSSAMGGYALAKLHFRFREFLFNFVLSTLALPTILLIAPTYQLLYWLGLLDTYAGLILPAIAPAFGIYLFRQAMINSVPDELIEAARIDGCGEFHIFFSIALPLVRPMTGAFLLITFLGVWNNYISPQVVLQSPDQFPLSVAIAQLKSAYSHEYGMMMAGTFISVFPVLLLFLALQRDFIPGLTFGAVKG